MLTRRAGCVERRSPSSTEAHRSNPQLVGLERCCSVRSRRSAAESNPGVLSDGRNAGTRKRPRSRIADSPRAGATGKSLCRFKRRGGAGAKRVRIPPVGVRANLRRCSERLVQLGLRGEPSTWRRAKPIPDRNRGPGANLSAVNSSTMRGPRGLASESDWRRCRTAKAIAPMGKGELLRSAP